MRLKRRSNKWQHDPWLFRFKGKKKEDNTDNTSQKKTIIINPTARFRRSSLLLQPANGRNLLGSPSVVLGRDDDAMNCRMDEWWWMACVHINMHLCTHIYIYIYCVRCPYVLSGVLNHCISHHDPHLMPHEMTYLRLWRNIPPGWIVPMHSGIFNLFWPLG